MSNQPQRRTFERRPIFNGYKSMRTGFAKLVKYTAELISDSGLGVTTPVLEVCGNEDLSGVDYKMIDVLKNTSELNILSAKGEKFHVIIREWPDEQKAGDQQYAKMELNLERGYSVTLTAETVGFVSDGSSGLYPNGKLTLDVNLPKSYMELPATKEKIKTLTRTRLFGGNGYRAVGVK